MVRDAKSKDWEPEQARAIESERRAAEAERRCDNYRQAFLRVLHERFTDLDATLNRLLDVLATTLDVDRVSFWVINDEQTAIHCTHEFHRLPPQRVSPKILKQQDFPDYFAAVSRQFIIDADNALTDPRTKELRDTYLNPLGITSMLDVPVRAFGRFIGILCHEHTRGPRRWSTEDQHFASAVATQVALAFERNHVSHAQQKLLHRSLFDTDTQLPNHVNFDNALTERLHDATNTTAVVVARIDQYKFVADTFGRQQAQELLRLAAERLHSRLPHGAFLARTALDEFALIANANVEQLSAEVVEWNACLQTPLLLNGENIYITLSTGFSFRDNTTPSNAEQLLTDARLAMFQAQQEGGARARAFSPELRAKLTNRVQIEQDLRRALAAREFAVHFQPVVDLRTGNCVGVEALLRWQHPTRGLLTPSEFIQVAIESGVILELGRRVLRAACEGIAKIRAQTGMTSLYVAVNMSAPEVLAPGTAELAYAELAKANLPADALIIEVTETALMLDLDRASDALRDLKAGGIRVGLDDFGTAFSSLVWLRKLPVDCVKIDRSFVEGIPTDQHNAAIVRAIVDLTRSFNQQVIAEGIETKHQLRSLRELGVSFGQGFLFAKAVPAEQFHTQWLSDIGSAI